MNNLEKGIKILKILNSNSFEAFIVGGAVRDYLLNMPINDIDITTNASIEDICRLFKNVVMEGSKYLSCRIIYEEVEFEVTMFRRDVEYRDHRHPVTVKADTLEQDLIRRDFTINAFAMNSEYQIIDIFNGKTDLANKIIRTIGDANTRFDEDALRVLRALYFSSKLDFNLDNEIIESFKHYHISYLKEEYVKDMVFKIISMKSNKGLEYINKYNILKDFPFYQELVTLSLKYKVKENLYALYMVVNKDLPNNILMTKKEKIVAIEVSKFVINKFNKESLFYGDLKYLKEAIELNNVMVDKKLKFEEVMNEYNGLVIHSPKEIDFDFTLINSNERSKAIKEVVINILYKNINNNFDDIKMLLGVKV